MIKKFLLAFAACNIFVAAASAYNVTFDIQADLLKTSTGAAMPTSGICLLVASTSNATFGTINAGASLTTGTFLDGGDDQILFKMDLSINSTPGSFVGAPSILTQNFSTNLDGNDPLILYWFPDLTMNTSTIPNTATQYGAFRTTTTQDGGQSWVMPGATTSGYRLYFLTSDAAIYGPGTHLPVESRSLLNTVVPEPSTYAMLLLAGLGGGVALRRRVAAV